MAAFDVNVKDGQGNDVTIRIEGVKTLAEAQAAAQAAGGKLNEPKAEDVAPIPEWLKSTIPAAPTPATNPTTDKE